MSIFSMLFRSKYSDFEDTYKSLEVASVSLENRTIPRKRANRMVVNTTNLYKSTKITDLRKFVAVDVETSGLDCDKSDIVEISAVKFVNFVPKEIFSTLVRPRFSIPDEVSRINNITDDMVITAPTFGQIVDSFSEFIGDCPIVAHNAPFDVRHIYANGFTGITNRQIYDTCALSRKFDRDIENHKLSTVCNHYNIYVKDWHRASTDAMACGMIFVQMILSLKDVGAISDLVR